MCLEGWSVKAATLDSNEVKYLTEWHLELSAAFQETTEEVQVEEGEWIKMELKESETEQPTRVAHAYLLHAPTTFRDCFVKVKKLVNKLRKLVSLLVADANYGHNMGEWDQPWNHKEFRDTLEMVEGLNHDSGDCIVAWFLSDKQLLVALEVVRDKGWDFRVKVSRFVGHPQRIHDAIRLIASAGLMSTGWLVTPSTDVGKKFLSKSRGAIKARPRAHAIVLASRGNGQRRVRPRETH